VAVRAQWLEVLGRAIRQATVTLPDDVVRALRAALERETADLARLHLGTLLEDERVARENGLPICQDTGTPVFFVRAGAVSPWLSDVESALIEATRAATDSIPLRPSAIHPFTDANVGNVGRGVPVIDWELVPGREIEITYVAKGGGSENASALLFVSPGGGSSAVAKAVLSHIVRVAPRACPPVVVGVGVGGTADSALRLAKRSLLRHLDMHSPDASIAAFESELLDAINRSGIGPAGLGGSTTALAVHADFAYRHPASLPVGVALQCWADRRATVRISEQGVAEVVE
jgi:fumarate hydratase subunit alpha